MTPTPPRILVVGGGRFGVQHLSEWARLAEDGEIVLAGAVAPSAATRERIAGQFNIPTYEGLDDGLLRTVDAVDIVTPPDSHAELVRRCLPLVHVLVEKPLATTVEAASELTAMAAELNRVLMVGHVFRFHPVIQEVKRIVAEIPERPRGIHGAMVNPARDGVGRAETNLEMLHLFDIVDFLFGVEPEVATARRCGALNHVSLRYPGPMTAVFELGWEGAHRRRTLDLAYSDRRISVDLVDNSVVVSTRNNQLSKSFFPHEPTALRDEFRTFVTALGTPGTPVPDGAVGERIVRVALASRCRPGAARPRIAVIGGGIFGATCALELSRIAQVTLYERHADLLTETSSLNQRRHHSGFHYPRSYDSITEIRSSREAFEGEYGEAIVRDFPSYYCTSATGVEIPAERYLAACRSNRLSFTVTDPPEGLVAAGTVSLCLRTDEGIYDITRLRRIVTDRLMGAPAVRCVLRTSVVGGAILPDGSKRITAQGPDGETEEAYDYVVNATYGGRNFMAEWFGFPVEPLRFDQFEILTLRLPIPQVSVTVMDGPFTSLTGTGEENLFLLAHIHDSVSRSVIPDDGLPPRWPTPVSNRDNLLRHSARYLPILSQATDIQSWFVTRAVNAYARDFDARPTVITDHGFGCWSVLGGKVVTSVVNAREIMEAIRTEQGAASPQEPRGGSVLPHLR